MPNVISKPSVQSGALLLGAALAAGGTALCLYLLLKDEDDWKLDRGSQMATSKQVTIDVKIPRESVGVVIGRQGSNIKEIQAKTDTRINFRDELETDTHRVCCIRGLSEDVQMAEILIHQTISQQPRLESLTMTVPGECVGRIIGRQGDTIRDIQRISGCKVDVDRSAIGSFQERKIVMRGTSKQLSFAKELIQEKVKEEEMMRSNISTNRQPRVKAQPLFLNYQSEDQFDSIISEQGYEVLEPIGGDNCCDVFVSGVDSPGKFWVQKVGQRSVDLDKLTQEMTDFYSDDTNRKLMAVTTVKVGDIVAAKFSQEDSFYRAKVVSINEDSYDFSASTFELFFVDFGDSEDKNLSELFELKTEYLKMKFQAIQCSLANIQPESGSSWSNESTDLFCKLTHFAMWKPICAKILNFNEIFDEIPIVELLDTNSGVDINIGAELVQRGLAK